MDRQGNDVFPAPSFASSRRPPACIACQQQKVRCTMDDRRPPCRRCQKRNLSCRVKNTALASSAFGGGIDDRFKEAIVDDMKTLHSAINEIHARSFHEPLRPLRSVSARSDTSSFSTNDVPVPPETENMDAGVDEGLNLPPITSLYHIRSLRSRFLPARKSSTDARLQKARDLISRSMLDVADANRLVFAYMAKPDQYLYGLASGFKDLNSIRNASSLLLTAICTVSALQDPAGQTLYRVCYTELRRLISDFTFVPHVDLEDFRGLCIACFWLSDISWSVSGLAIRRAMEFGLHKSFQAVIEPTVSSASVSRDEDMARQNTSIECTRLWYLFYICDQHLSILYGRPSIVREQESIRSCETYLAAALGVNTDVRIVSQICLLRILSTVSELFGSKTDVRIFTMLKPQIDLFNAELNQWLTTWLGRYERHREIGSFPSKVVTLHFYFAKLFVCSHVFRGQASDPTSDPIPEVFRETASMAVESAKSIVDLVTRDDDLRSTFFNVPHYFHTMIAFACSFLLKITTKFFNQVEINTPDVFDMVSQVVRLCKEGQQMPYHLARLIGEGLQTLLINCANAASKHAINQRGQSTDYASAHPTVPVGTFNPTIPSYTSGAVPGMPNAWDAARDAAISNQSDALVNYSSHGVSGNAESASGIHGAASQDDVLGNLWDPFLAAIDIEHMGLGLL